MNAEAAAMRSRDGALEPVAMQRWADAGVGVVRPAPSRSGALTRRIETEHGAVVAMLVPAARGKEVELDELTPHHAARWGAALARVHTVRPPAPPAGSGAPEPTERRSARMARTMLTDEAFARSVAEVAAATAALDPSTHTRGTIHGDFELDNLRFDGDETICFDADERREDWFAADVALAARDLTGVTLGSEPRPELLGAFLAGYRGVRTFTADEERSLPLFGRAASAVLVADLDEVLDLEEHIDDAEWLMELRASLGRHRQWHRARVLASASLG